MPKTNHQIRIFTTRLLIPTSPKIMRIYVVIVLALQRCLITSGGYLKYKILHLSSMDVYNLSGRCAESLSVLTIVVRACFIARELHPMDTSYDYGHFIVANKRSVSHFLI